MHHHIQPFKFPHGFWGSNSVFILQGKHFTDRGIIPELCFLVSEVHFLLRGAIAIAYLILPVQLELLSHWGISQSKLPVSLSLAEVHLCLRWACFHRMWENTCRWPAFVTNVRVFIAGSTSASSTVWCLDLSGLLFERQKREEDFYISPGLRGISGVGLKHRNTGSLCSSASIPAGDGLFFPGA